MVVAPVGCELLGLKVEGQEKRVNRLLSRCSFFAGACLKIRQVDWFYSFPARCFKLNDLSKISPRPEIHKNVV